MGSAQRYLRVVLGKPVLPYIDAGASLGIDTDHRRLTTVPDVVLDITMSLDGVLYCTSRRYGAGLGEGGEGAALLDIRRPMEVMYGGQLGFPTVVARTTFDEMFTLSGTMVLAVGCTTSRKAGARTPISWCGHPGDGVTRSTCSAARNGDHRPASLPGHGP